MNDIDLEHDEELVRRIRDSLAAVAAVTPVGRGGTVTPLPGSSKRPRLLFAAAAALVALVVGAGVMLAGRDVDTTVTNPAPEVSPSPLPESFDVATAAPVFTARGDAAVVAHSYLESRFPDFPAPGVTLSMVEESAASAKARWHTGEDDGRPIAEGDLLMRRDADRWVIVASTTESIDAGSVAFDGATLTGVIRSTSEDSLFADVLDWAEQPVRHAPMPGGASPEMPTIGTAGGPATGSLALNIPHPGAPAIIRVRLVGGTVLGITEFRLDPPPLAPHRDFDACVRAHTTPEKEPTPDIVARNCAMALEGDVFASGSALDREWQLVASEEPSGRWITLRFRDQVGMFRTRADGPAVTRDVYEAKEGVERAEACCAGGDTTFVVVVLHPDIAKVRLLTSAGTVIGADAFLHIDRRFAVIPVKPIVEGETGGIVVQRPNGAFVAASDATFSLAVLGG